MSLKSLTIASILFLTISLHSCIQNTSEKSALDWAVHMAESDMKRNPQAWMIDFRKSPKWGYTNGLMGSAYLELSLETDNDIYKNYLKNGYYDVLIDSAGQIKGYKMRDYNIDKINSGKALFALYKSTGDNRYKTVMDTLRSQMASHPRTRDGGFWHKKRYAHQMWLDGIYMADPFLAQYAKVFNDTELMDGVVNQLLTVQKYTYDAHTGLNYHAYDESRNQRWSDSITGQSPHFWGRAQGWYCMSIVDVLDYLPSSHPKRHEIIGNLQNILDALLKVQDSESGMWYQVLDQGKREGNYLESTCSSMFTYCLLKSIRLGYIDDTYQSIAENSYQNLIKAFVKEEEDGGISLTQCCAVAGLGGNPYRDGTFEYYISEPIRDNDPKGVGPFILASIEMDRLNN